MLRLDQYLEGTIDLHCHVYPEMTLEHEARQAVELGALVELCALQTISLNQHIAPSTLVEIVTAVGRRELRVLHRCLHGFGAGPGHTIDSV